MSEKVIIYTIDDVSRIGLLGRPLILDDDLAELVLISLFTDRQALPTDELPPDTTNRRGWWADFLDAKKEKIGSRLWLINRAKNLEPTLRKIEDYSREALKWLIDHGVAKDVKTTATRTATQSASLLIEIYQPDNIYGVVSSYWQKYGGGRYAL